MGKLTNSCYYSEAEYDCWCEGPRVGDIGLSLQHLHHVTRSLKLLMELIIYLF